MNKSRNSGLLIASCAVMVLAALYIGAGALRARDTATTIAATAGAATLDPALYKGPAHEAYRIARKHPELLAQLHCYCGCDREHGHNNLLDCFRDTHGGHCAICVGEAIEAERLYNSGTPVDQIRDALRQRFNRHES
jgi:hypothetical protein